ncbi:helix-turn-helix domain-containing protein, partial [Vibrio cholerae]
MKHDELNERLRTFLISSRENAGLSQSDVAARSEVFGIGRTLDQRAVSRIESQPMNADAIKIAGYLSAVGIQPSKYYEILTEYTYKEDDYIMSEVGEQTIKIKVEAAKSLISSVKDSIDCYNHEYIDSIGLKSKVEQLEAVVDGLNRKPVIGCFGHFDAGKSTLINTVINQSLLPTKYQPATCVVNLLMHESDKPETISGNVAVFKKGFKPHMVHSPVDVEKYLIEQGGSEILDRLGVHNHEDDVLNEAYIAIVFSDSEILRSV